MVTVKQDVLETQIKHKAKRLGLFCLSESFKDLSGKRVVLSVHIEGGCKHCPHFTDPQYRKYSVSSPPLCGISGYILERSEADFQPPYNCPHKYTVKDMSRFFKEKHSSEMV